MEIEDVTATKPVRWSEALGGYSACGTLGWLKTQARIGVPVWAVCQACAYSGLLDAGDLLALTKPNTTDLSSLAHRMRCRACGSKACELRGATPVPEYCS